MAYNKVLIVVLIILNAIVLLGQLWPQGAPPFARVVNILFLICSLIFFLVLLVKNKSHR
jgi:hypothetical protein